MKILIAEDNPVPRRVLEATLEKWGYELVVACDGTEAWDCFQEHKDELRIAILDWMMPGMDGLELCRRIRASDIAGYVYIILLTAKGQKDDIVEGLEAGADDYVTKPFSPGELRSRIAAGVRVVRYENVLSERNAALQRLLTDTQQAKVEAEQFSEQLKEIIAMGEKLKHNLQDTVEEVYRQSGIIEKNVTPHEILVQPEMSASA